MELKLSLSNEHKIILALLAEDPLETRCIAYVFAPLCLAGLFFFNLAEMPTVYRIVWFVECLLIGKLDQCLRCTKTMLQLKLMKTKPDYCIVKKEDFDYLVYGYIPIDGHFEFMEHYLSPKVYRLFQKL